MSKVFIIAEAGVNHNGQLDLAIEMVDRSCKREWGELCVFRRLLDAAYYIQGSLRDV